MNTADSAAVRHLPATLALLTAMQAVMAGALFGVGVAAPQLGIPLEVLGLFNAVVFALGAVGSAWAGPLCARLGAHRIAAACLALAAAASLAIAVAPHAGLWIAALLFGLAFGPETPSSSALLVRVTPPARRGWIFSLRQTGNQWGAMSASLALPAAVALAGAAAFGAVALAALALAAALCRLGPRLPPAPAPTSAPARTGGVALVLANPALRRLLPAAFAYSALQVSLNAFAYYYLRTVLELPAGMAGIALATAQGAGLAGRLLWGRTGDRLRHSAPLLGGIGLAMAAAMLLFTLLPAAPAPAVLLPLMIAAGFTVSGWNGLFVAEVARLAGPAHTAAATGAMLSAGFVGLVAGPLLFALLGDGLQAWAYRLTAGAAALAALPLLHPGARQR